MRARGWIAILVLGAPAGIEDGEVLGIILARWFLCDLLPYEAGSIL